MSTRYVALFFIAQSAPCAVLGHPAWGIASAVLGCGMWALGLLEARQTKEENAARNMEVVRLNAAVELLNRHTERLATLEQGAVATTQSLASISSRVSMNSLGG